MKRSVLSLFLFVSMVGFSTSSFATKYLDCSSTDGFYHLTVWFQEHPSTLDIGNQEIDMDCKVSSDTVQCRGEKGAGDIYLANFGWGGGPLREVNQAGWMTLSELACQVNDDGRK